MPRPLTYAQLNAAALADEVLTSRDLRVLGALSLFDRPRSGRPFTVLRQAIAEITGLPETRVSECASKLERRGWIERVTQGGGRRTGSAYVINWQATEPTVTDGRTVSPPGTVRAGVTVSDADTVTDSRTVSPTVTDGRTDSAGTVPANRTVVSPPLESPPCSSSTVLPNSTNYASSQSGLGDGSGVPPKPDENDAGPAAAASKMQRVTDLLIGAGMPMHYLLNVDDRKSVIAWCEHYTEDEIAEACRRAQDARRSQGDARPIGVRYLDAILRNPRTSSSSGGPGWMERADRAGDDFLEDHEPRISHAAG